MDWEHPESGALLTHSNPFQATPTPDTNVCAVSALSGMPVGFTGWC